MIDAGLDYLTLDRAAETLSGGEAQRIAWQPDRPGLVGVMYILDEPSIGFINGIPTPHRTWSLRPKTGDRRGTRRDDHAADHVVDMGLGAGSRWDGGQRRHTRTRQASEASQPGNICRALWHQSAREQFSAQDDRWLSLKGATKTI